MIRNRWLTILIAVWFVWASPVRAQDIKEILNIIPEDASAFVLANRLDQSNEKIYAMLKKMKAPLPASPLDLAKAVLGVSKGLNEKGSAGVILFPPPKEGDDPVPVYVVPVSNYKDFVDQFMGKDGGITEITLETGHKLAAAQKGQYAILSRTSESEALKKILGAKRHVLGWSQPLQTWMAGNDVVAVATPHGIKTRVAMIRSVLDTAKPILANVFPTAVQLIDGLDGFLKSVASDVTHLAVGATLDKTSNLHLEARALFAPGSGFAKGAAPLKAAATSPLSGLPSGSFALAWGGLIPDDFLRDWIKINIEAAKAVATASGKEITKAQADKLEQTLLPLAHGPHGASFFLREGKPGRPIAENIVAMIKVDDARAYLGRYEKALKELSGLSKELKVPGLDQPFDVKRMMVGNIDVVEVSAKSTDVTDPIQKKLIDAIFGPGEKLTKSLAAADNNTVIVTFRPAATMPEAVKAYAQNKVGLVNDANVAGILPMLPQGAQWVFLAEPKGILATISNILKTAAPDSGIVIPALPATPPVAVGARLSESGLILTTVVPAQVLETVGKHLQGQD